MPVKTGPIGDDELDGLFAGLANCPLALAVSGGADSMALMHLAARWWAQSGRKAIADNYALGPPSLSPEPEAAPPWLAGVRDADDLDARGGLPPIVVLTVDHGLRPGSAADAQFVAAEAAKLGLPCAILRWEGPKPATGVQEAARDARRQLLIAAVGREFSWNIDLLARAGRTSRPAGRIVLMGHHAGDQAETFLMRLARGSGLDGLSAIRTPDAEPNGDNEGGFWRPLIDVPPARLRATLEAAGLTWREDPSNADERFERVRVRKALAVLSELGVDASAIAASAARLGAARRGYMSLIADGPERAIDWHEGVMAELDIRRWPDDVVVRVLRSVLSALGGASRPAQLSQVEALVARLATDTGTDETLGGCRVQAHGVGKLRVYREVGRGLPVCHLAPGGSVDWDKRCLIRALPGLREAVEVAALGGAGWAALKRRVPRLERLPLPAAAMQATVAIRRDGEIIAVPALSAWLAADRPGADAVAHAELSQQLGHNSAHFSAEFRRG